MKRIVLSAVVLLAAIAVHAATTTIGDYTWSYTVSDGEATITGVSPTSGGIAIPSSVASYPVTSIGNLAFSCCSGLTSVTIPDGVTSIGDSAFYYCKGLKSVTISDSVTSIGKDAFASCSGLTSVTIGNGVTSIGEGLFRFCSNLGSMTIPDSVMSIGSEAFWGCGFSGVTIPDSVTTIGDMAFSDCSNLGSVRIGNGVTSIGNRAFSGCSRVESFDVGASNPNYKSVNGLLLSKNGAELIAGVNGDVTIPDSVTSIGDYSFYNCSWLMSITIPDSVTSIGERAFSGCSRLTSVTIGNGVTSIGDWAFSGCSGLTGVFIRDLAKWCAISFADSYANPLYYAHNLYLNGLLATDLVIPDGVASIGSCAFYYCKSLISVTIPTSVTNIGDMAFCECSSIMYFDVGASNPNYKSVNGLLLSKGGEELIVGVNKDVIIPDGVTSIGDYAFFDCNGLTSVTIPDSVTSIGERAFYHCIRLTSVTIGNGVTSIGDSAFYYCSGLTGVFISDLAKWCAISFAGSYANPLCYAHNLYFNGSLVTDLVIPSGVTSIGSYAFRDCDALTSVTIPDSVKSIGDSAFYECIGLTSVMIPEGVTNIGSYAFSGCRGLTSVTIGNGVTSIGNYAFQDCSGLTGVFISDLAKWCAISFAGSYANPLCYAHNLYLNGSLVTDLVIPSGVTSIGDYAFYNCRGLTNMTIPNSVTSIGSEAFSYCSGLTSVTIPDSVTSIGSRAFAWCSGLTGVMIPGSVTSIGEWAFTYCSRLEKVYVPNLLQGTFDEGNVFSVCSSALEIEYYRPIPEVAGDADEATVEAAVDEVGFADAQVKAVIGGSAAEYNAFKAWTSGIDGGVVAVQESSHAAASYLFGAAALFENEPEVEIGKVVLGERTGESRGPDMHVEVVVKDGENPVAVAAEKVAAMFEATSDLGDWSGAAKLSPSVTVKGTDASGTMSFTVTPGDGTAARAFLRIRR